MNDSSVTVIHFDYEGYYSTRGEIRWISKEDKVYSLLMNTSREEISYSGLVEKICRKVHVDEAKMNLRISYVSLMLEVGKPNYILDDEDVLCYLMEVGQAGRRSVLHVEVDNSVNQNQGFEQFSRDDWDDDIIERNEEVLPSGRVNARSSDIVLYEGESSEHLQVVDDDIVEVFGVTDEYEVRNVVEVVEPEILGWDDGLDLRLGDEFDCKHDVQDLVEKAGHTNCFEFDTVWSDKLRYVVKCSEFGSGCKWYFRAARIKNSNRWSVRTHYKIHSCSRVDSSTSKVKRKGTPRLVASLVAEDYPGLISTPTPKELVTLVQNKLSIKVSYATAWRGKRQAVADVRGSPEECFRLLYQYMYVLHELNPGTVSRVEVDEENKFKYLFFALGACIEGFKAMRKVIIVDGTHLKSVQGGVLIVATAQDPDHHHYPIAFGVVDGEKNESWTWFFQKLKTIVPDDREMVFVSDRHASLIKAIGEVYPLSTHGYCIYHLAQNVKGSVHPAIKEQVQTKFMECARAYTEVEFKKLYGEFRSRYPKAGEYLDKSVHVTKWARCYFLGERYNIDTTNAAESINSVLRGARALSLLGMIDVIVDKIAEWFNKHRKSAVETTTQLVPFVENELHAACAIAKRLHVVELNSFALQYKVIGKDGNTYCVDLRKRSCSCKYFDIEKIPCVHAIAAAAEAKKISCPTIQTHDLCSKYYSVELWVLAYCRTIYPVPHKNQWNVPDDIQVLFTGPPDYVRKRGRPQVTRFTSTGEYGRKKGKSKERETMYNYLSGNGPPS